MKKELSIILIAFSGCQHCLQTETQCDPIYYLKFEPLESPKGVRIFSEKSFLGNFYLLEDDEDFLEKFEKASDVVIFYNRSNYSPEYVDAMQLIFFTFKMRIGANLSWADSDRYFGGNHGCIRLYGTAFSDDYSMYVDGIGQVPKDESLVDSLKKMNKDVFFVVCHFWTSGPSKPRNKFEPSIKRFINELNNHGINAVETTALPWVESDFIIGDLRHLIPTNSKEQSKPNQDREIDAP